MHNYSKCEHEYCFRISINKFRNFQHYDFSYRPDPENAHLPGSPLGLLTSTPTQSLPDMGVVLNNFGIDLNLDNSGDYSTDHSPLYINSKTTLPRKRSFSLPSSSSSWGSPHQPQSGPSVGSPPFRVTQFLDKLFPPPTDDI